MQTIETPLLGASQVCSNCHTFHIHFDCGYRESKKDELVSESVCSRGFKRRESYSGLGEESNFCGLKGVLLECENDAEHQYLKRLYCGREWCPICGQDYSDMHKRRYMRLMDKVFYLGDAGKYHGLGYFVFTVPLGVREKLKNKSRLQKAGRFVRELLKTHGFNIGISRWHFFGDGQITEGELDLGVYHPHLNCLVVGRWVGKKTMKAIKKAWRRYLERLSGESIEVVDIWYNYYQEKGEWWHKGAYVTRATLKVLEGHESLVRALYGFRNLCYWGFGKGLEKEAKLKHGRVVLGLWFQGLKKDNDDGITKKEYEDLVIISHMECPKCADEGHYNVKIQMAMNLTTGGRDIRSLDEMQPRIEKDLGAGFYSLSNVMSRVKPMSLEEGDAKSLEDAYDTS